MDILLALVTANCFYDVSLLYIDNQHLFPQCHNAIFLYASGGKMDHMGHLQPKSSIESHSYLNLLSLFYLKAYLCYTEPFRKRSDGCWVSSLFLGN